MSHAQMIEIDNQFDKFDLLDRIKDLKDVAAWSMENGGLSSGQRICLHQERAKCLQKIEELQYGPYISEGYKIPQHLEEKVQHILRVIKDTGWEKQECKY